MFHLTKNNMTQKAENLYRKHAITGLELISSRHNIPSHNEIVSALQFACRYFKGVLKCDYLTKDSRKAHESNLRHVRRYIGLYNRKNCTNIVLNCGIKNALEHCAYAYYFIINGTQSPIKNL